MPEFLKTARSFVPGHITGFFAVHDDPDPRKKGSTGCGMVLDAGIWTIVFPGVEKTEVLLDGNPVCGETIISVIEQLTDIPVKVECSSSIPVGCGFGASAAGALSTAYALNEALDLGMTSNRLLEIAHIAEVSTGGGMGDVEGQA